MLWAPQYPGQALSNSPWASLSAFALSSAASWLSVRIRPSCATLASKALSRLAMVLRSWRTQTPRTPVGETRRPCQFVGHAGVAPGRLLQRHLEDPPLDRLADAVFRVRHPPRHLDQRRLTALSIQVPEPVEAVAGKSHDPAGLADAAELLRQLQHADLVADDLLVSRHRVVSSLRYSMSTLGDDTPTIATCQI